MKLTTLEIARATGGVCDTDTAISSICIDSRAVTPGCLFVALVGERFDGHEYAAAAEAFGAAAVLAHSEVTVGVPVIKVNNTGEALLALAEYWRGQFDIPVVGVTGSVGKTTTKDMVACVLGARYNTLKTQGNYNNEVGLPLTLFQLDGKTQAAVIEMGMSGFGEIERLSRTTKPTMGIITKIGVSHIEKLGSKEGILQAKLEILKGMPPNAPLLVSGDDPLLVSVASPEYPVILFGIENPDADYRAVNIRQEGSGSLFEIVHPKGREAVSLPTFGLHNVTDAVAAFAAGVLCGVLPAEAAAALGGYTPSGMRQKVVQTGGITVIEDCYNASPDSVKAALDALDMLAGEGRKIAVLGDMLELGEIAEEAHNQCGVFAAEKADLLLAFGELARYYKKGAQTAGIAESRHCSGADELVEALIRNVHPGDTVLFKASRGMKLERIIDAFYEEWKKLC